VATSAVREATNADTFVDRVEAVSGIRLHVLDAIDEARLSYGALQKNLRHIPHFRTSDSLLLDIGAGSLEITVFHKGRIVYCQTRRAGALRLRESFGEASQGHLPELITPLVDNVVDSVRRLVPLGLLENFLLIRPDASRLFPPQALSGPTGMSRL